MHLRRAAGRGGGSATRLVGAAGRVLDSFAGNGSRRRCGTARLAGAARIRGSICGSATVCTACCCRGGGAGCVARAASTRATIRLGHVNADIRRRSRCGTDSGTCRLRISTASVGTGFVSCHADDLDARTCCGRDNSHISHIATTVFARFATAARRGHSGWVGDRDWTDEGEKILQA